MREDVVDYIREQHPKQIARMQEKADAAMKRWKAGLPVFRENAEFREEAALIWTSLPDYDWFSDLADDPQFTMMCALQGTEPDMQTTLTTWVCRKLRSVSSTSNWFRPTEGLTYKLLATDLKGALIGDLSLPMASFYIQLPPSVFYLEDKSTGWHNVRALIVTKGCVTPQTLEIAGKSYDGADKVELGERLIIEAYGDPNQNSSNPLDDTWLFKSYRIDNREETVEAAIERSLRGEAASEKAANRGKLGERLLDGLEIRDLMLKFVLNFCIYLNTEKGAPQHAHAKELERLHGGKKFKNLRKPVQEKIKRLQNDRVFDVGTDVTVDHAIREIVRTEGAGSFHLSYRTLVRGHWRQQPSGPGRVLRVRRWIEPHIRGADLPTKVVGHNYDVK